MAEAEYLVGASLPHMIKLSVEIFHGYPDKGSKLKLLKAKGTYYELFIIQLSVLFC